MFQNKAKRKAVEESKRQQECLLTEINDLNTKQEQAEAQTAALVEQHHELQQKWQVICLLVKSLDRPKYCHCAQIRLHCTCCQQLSHYLCLCYLYSCHTESIACCSKHMQQKAKSCLCTHLHRWQGTHSQVCIHVLPLLAVIVPYGQAGLAQQIHTQSQQLLWCRLRHKCW